MVKKSTKVGINMNIVFFLYLNYSNIKALSKT